jgi:D-serine deaminase-like pyridoxal phosphate-dependent protein
MESLRERIETPNVVIDYKKLVENLHLIQDIANEKKVNLRPHIKVSLILFNYNIQDS